MKKTKLTRELLVPDTDFCIMWKNQKEICPMLTFGKLAGQPSIVWKCTFFDKDIKQNIDSYGIKKFCMEHNNKGSIHSILDSKKFI